MPTTKLLPLDVMDGKKVILVEDDFVATIQTIQLGFVLLCPAWKNWGSAAKLKSNSVVLHSRQDDVISLTDPEELVASRGLPSETLIEVGSDHRCRADAEPMEKMLESCGTLKCRNPSSEKPYE